MENEYGEQIGEKELTSFAERVRKLAPEKIDEVWFICGFIYSERESGMKALSNEHLEKVKESLESAEDVVSDLLLETHVEEFRKNLEKVEKL